MRGGNARASGPVNDDPMVKLIAYPDFRLKSRVGSVTPNVNGFTPAQLQQAYGLNVFQSGGAGVIVAVIDACGNSHVQADLHAFDLAYNLPATTIRVVKPEGTPCSDPRNWGIETDLDVQMVHAVAPFATIVLEEAKTASFADLIKAAQDAYMKQGATIVSMSFSGPEFSGETGSRADGVFSQGNALGVSFTAASGDNGCGAQYPAASPYVLSVGGTSLNLSATGTYSTETAWKGSGGGLSAYESRPVYQNGVNASGKRAIPDVSIVADPNTGVAMYDSDIGDFNVAGGTSVGAPLWAGILALANSMRFFSMTNASNDLYTVAYSRYTSNYHDIKSGSSGSACIAGTGYDTVTGLGSPVSVHLVPNLTIAP